MTNPAQRSRRLFLSVVVVGTRLAGCGGQTTDDDSPAPAGSPPPNGPTGPSGANSSATGNPAASPAPTPVSSSTVPPPSAPLVPTDCEHPQQFSCSGGLPSTDPNSTCSCNESAPLDASDCASDLEFACVGSAGLDFYGCTCDVALGQSLYEMCDPPTTLFCEQFLPRYDRCSCDAAAPISEADCEPGTNFSCQSVRPVFGCLCDPRPIGIR